MNLPAPMPAPVSRRRTGHTVVEEVKEMSTAPATKLLVEHLVAGFGKATILRDVQLVVPEKSVLAVIGPSGCGKTTFLRCLNRMHELVKGAWSTGIPFRRSPAETLSRIDMVGNGLGRWKTIPTRRRRSTGSIPRA